MNRYIDDGGVIHEYSPPGFYDDVFTILMICIFLWFSGLGVWKICNGVRPAGYEIFCLVVSALMFAALLIMDCFVEPYPRIFNCWGQG